MKKLLYIIVNPKFEVSLSKGQQIGEVFLEAFKEAQPDVEIKRLNLYEMDIPEVDSDLLSARAKLSFMGYTLDQLTQTELEKIQAMHRTADEFIEADYYVFVTPLWNLSSPPKLKTYLDNLFIYGKTFINTEAGAKGLLAGRAIHIQTRGGIYSTGPMAEFEFGDRYLTASLSFLGLDVETSIIAEGMDHFPKQAAEIIEQAKISAVKAAKAMAKLPALQTN